MKFLDLPSLESLQLNEDLGDSTLVSKIEAYSCKRVGSDKKLSRSLEQQYCNKDLSQSPSERELSTSPFGSLTEVSSRKTLSYLLATLNASYVDYDFTRVRPEQFSKESVNSVVSKIDSTLSAALNSDYLHLRDKMWGCFDQEIELRNCDVYSYMPDHLDDPFTEEGIVWSFNYFFYNRTLKRILYFSCKCMSKSAQEYDPYDSDVDTDERIGWGDYEEEVANNMEY